MKGWISHYWHRLLDFILCIPKVELKDLKHKTYPILKNDEVYSNLAQLKPEGGTWEK